MWAMNPATQLGLAAHVSMSRWSGQHFCLVCGIYQTAVLTLAGLSCNVS